MALHAKPKRRAKKAKKPLRAGELYLQPEALVADDRLFRAELVASVLKLFNAVYLTKPLGRTNESATAEPLAWVREVNRIKAVAGHFPLNGLTVWEDESHPGNAICPNGQSPAPIQRLAMFFQGIVPDPGRGTVMQTLEALSRPEHVSMRERRITWLNSVLSELNEWTKLRFENGQVVETSLIQLNTVERCIAYTIALLLQNRDELRDRIRVCTFTGRDMANQHYFLDFRLEADGKLARGEAQTYCCARHAGAARQQRNRSSNK